MSTELATAYLSLVPSLRGAQHQIASQLNGTAGSAGATAGRRFGVNFGNLAKRIIAGAAIYKGVTAAYGFAKEAIFGFNSTLEQSTIAFTTMLGSGQKAKKFLDQLQNFAKATPFEFEGLVHNAQTMMGMGVAAKDVLPTLKALGDSVASVGGGADVLNNTILAFSQTMAKGTLDMGNMNQLLQGGIPSALKVLAASYHVTTGEMVKMISAGKVQSKDALPRLVKGLEQGTKSTAALGGMMDKQSQTFQGALGNIEDALTQSLAGAFKPFFVATSKGLQGFASWLSGPRFQQFSDWLTNTLVAGMSLAGSAIMKLKPVAVAVFQRVLIPTFQAIMGLLPHVVKFLQGMWDVVAPLARDVAGIFFKGWQAVLGVFKVIGPWLDKISGWMRDHAVLIRSVAVAVGAAVLAWKAWKLGIAAWMAITKVATAVQAAFNVVMNANPVMLVVTAIAALAAGLIYAYKHSETFRRIVNGAFRAVKTVVLGVVNWFRKDFIGFFTRTIPGAFRTMLGWIKSAWSAVWSFLKTWGPRALLVLAPFIGIPLLIWRHFKGIKNFISRAFGIVWGFLKGVGSTAKSILKTFVGIPAWIWDHFKKIPGYIGGAFKKAWDAATGWIGKILDGVHRVKNAISGFGLGNANAADVLGLTPAQRKKLGFNAQGTNDWRGGLTWVGERGPELVNLPRHAQVIPNRESMRIAGGGNTYNIYEVQTPEAVAVAIQRREWLSAV